jgi:crotonobetainyl-CoA:carnitine CoA-transferase CaiB-like acyl-CoA transferase
VIFMEKDLLGGIRILDFSRVLAGPYATRTLGDFGAEVIKVQTRKTANGTESNDVPYFAAWNRNKRSITLNLDLPESREVVLKLVSICDVVVENFSPRVMFNWGLNYEKLVEVKKDLIMVSMSGMGQTGPWKDYVAYGPTVQSLGGLTYLTAYDRELPVGLGHSYADVISGLYCAVAVLSALEYRSRSGLGQFVDMSEYEVVCTLLGPALMDVAANQIDTFPVGNRSPDIPAAPYGCYRCSGSDRWCVIAILSETEWHALCTVSDHLEWISDERFRTAAARKKNEEELDSLIQQWTSRCEAEWIMQALQEAGIAAGVVQTAEDLARDPQLKAREFFVPLFHPALGATFMDRTPIRMAGGSPQNWSAAPRLGADNRYVYLELLGLSESEFQAYSEKGVFS